MQNTKTITETITVKNEIKGTPWQIKQNFILLQQSQCIHSYEFGASGGVVKFADGGDMELLNDAVLSVISDGRVVELIPVIILL